MAPSAFDPTLEHPLDVLRAALRYSQAGQRIALVALAATDGGGVRAPGALMVIDAVRSGAGYLSGGCIDADVMLQAQAALAASAPRRVRYGQGSPFVDLSLPCGGAIEVVITPDPDLPAIHVAVEQLAARQPIAIAIEADGLIRLGERFDAPSAALVAMARPKLRLRIAGRGADALALARIAAASGYDVVLWSQDPACLAAASGIGIIALAQLTTQSALPAHGDDPWTAFALMGHDPDWEAALLMDALNGPAFFIGAVGSRKAQARRAADLRQRGCAPATVERVRGPIGLVPSLRDASMLAVSALAEIIAEWRETPA